MLQPYGIFLSDMKKQVSTKKLLQALLQTYMDTHDRFSIYEGDGSELMTVDEAVEFVDGLKEEASPEQVAFESQLDTMMEEFRNVFPPSMDEAEREAIHDTVVNGSMADQGTWFDLMHSVWNKHVQVELMKRYSNL